MNISFVVPGDSRVKVASVYVKVYEDNDLSIYINGFRVGFFDSHDKGKLTLVSLPQHQVEELEQIGFQLGDEKRIRVRS